MVCNGVDEAVHYSLEFLLVFSCPVIRQKKTVELLLLKRKDKNIKDSDTAGMKIWATYNK